MSAAAGSTAAVAAASSPAGAAVAPEAKPKFDLGLIRKAIAFRVKYRLVGENGSLKRRLPLRIMGGCILRTGVECTLKQVLCDSWELS